MDRETDKHGTTEQEARESLCFTPLEGAIDNIKCSKLAMEPRTKVIVTSFV
jgi:hypothetical protein